jgi:hypothetical protein
MAALLCIRPVTHGMHRVRVCCHAGCDRAMPFVSAQLLNMYASKPLQRKLVYTVSHQVLVAYLQRLLSGWRRAPPCMPHTQCLW